MYSIAPLSRSKLPTSLTITPTKPDYFRWLKNTFSTNVKKILHEVSNNNWFENFESPDIFTSVEVFGCFLKQTVA